MKIKDSRVLLLTLGSHQLAQTKAFEDASLSCWSINWKAFAISGKLGELSYTIQAFHPHLSFLQLQSTLLPVEFVRAIPGVKVLWTGDVREPFPDYSTTYLNEVSISLFTNEEDVSYLRSHNRTAGFLDIGYDDGIFMPDGVQTVGHDVVFFGNNYVNRFPLSRSRMDLVNFLTRIPRIDVGVYGKNWGDLGISDLTNNPFEEAAIYRSSKIGINYSHFNRTNYSSDRIYRMMGSGCFCLAYHHKGIEKSFTPGVHLDTWRDFSELEHKIQYWLENPCHRYQIARAGCTHVQQNHSWKKRVEQLEEILNGNNP